MSAHCHSVTNQMGQGRGAGDSNVSNASCSEPRPSSIDAHPLASLIREHELIGPLAEGLARFAEGVRAEAFAAASEREELGQFVRVFTELADCVHHEKEETVLLPFLCRHGFEWTDGPLAEVRREHRQERYLIDVLCQAAAREETWTHDERRRIVDTAAALAEFQREHLSKENTLLFPAVLSRTSAPELDALARELAAFDVSVARFLPYHELTALARELISRHGRGVSREPANESGASREASSAPVASGRTWGAAATPV